MEVKNCPFSLKAVDTASGIFSGYASVFDVIDSGKDVVLKGAFTKSLNRDMNRIKILWQHDNREPIGIPLEIREDSRGLFIRAKLSKTQRGLDALILMRDNVVNELSIGYDTVQHSYKGAVRQLKEVKLWEVSPVTWAMNSQALITAVKNKSISPEADRLYQRFCSLFEQMENQKNHNRDVDPMTGAPTGCCPTFIVRQRGK
jgi:HK97 family phage prohead protease